MVKQEHVAAAAASTRKIKNNNKKKKKKKKKKNKNNNVRTKLDHAKEATSSGDHANEPMNHIPSTSKPFERPDTWKRIAQVPPKHISSS